MIRPTFPQWYLEHEKPDQLPEASVVAIVSTPWKVGDLIEWWYTDCYQTGKIIELLGDDKVKVKTHSHSRIMPILSERQQLHNHSTLSNFTFFC